ncbi:MAG: LysR family transcriptional regulator [Burkholderiales bacterium]|nr:LysR family transcriptional regulator [Burkholderiales bacterium]
MLSSTALRYFAEVVRQGSLSAAAETLCIAPSAISRQIALLEEELDASLFERRRGRRQQHLTAAGEHLMGYVYEVEAETRRIRSDVQSLKGMQKGRIRLGMTEGFIHCLMPGLLAQFHAQYPAIAFDVEVANTPRLMELLADGHLDLILGFNPPQADDIRIVAEVRLPRQLIVPADHPLAQRASVRLSDCAAYGMGVSSFSVQ